MKTGRTLAEIAAELDRQKNTRKDFIASQGAIVATVVDGDVKIAGLNGGPMPITEHAHRQIADHLEIPGRYYERMKAAQPELLAANVNTWLHAGADDKRMVRTLDGQVRAFLSSKYRPLDNYDLAEVILPALLDLKVDIMSAELTSTRMYIKGILPELSEPLPAGLTHGVGHANIGNRLVAALVVSNSEVGAGTLRIEPSVFTTWCTNLAITKSAAMKKYHVGRANDADTNFEVFRDETRQADDRAFFLKVGDVARAAFNPDVFRAAIAQIREAAGDPIVSTNLPEVVEVAVERLKLPVSSQNSILAHLARGGDLSRWGLSSAITATANDFPDYEGATLLERAGGEVIALSPADWKSIAA